MKKIPILVFSALSILSLLLLVFTLFSLERARDALESFVAEEESLRQSLAGTPDTHFTNRAALTLWNEKKQATEEENTDVAQYRSPEGILFRSQSYAWDQDMLVDLYQELLRNKHGDEINYLSQVIVMPNADDNASAFYQEDTTPFTLSLPFPAFPSGGVFSFQRTRGVITLYNGDKFNTIPEMAESLSHEYGHHYTFFYMLGEDYTGSQYVAVRKLDPSRVKTIAPTNEYYWENHHWFYHEIAAEDYVVLMGSPTTRQIGDYCDIREWLIGEEGDLVHHRNVDIQENLMIPIATQVPGLAEFFYSFIEEPPPSLNPKDLTLSIEKETNHYDMVTGSKSLTHYKITWDKVYGEDAAYTLVCYDPASYRTSLLPIRTVTQGEAAEGITGHYSYKANYMVYSWDDELAKGTKTYLVTVICPDGSMYLSDSLTYTF